ncbi:MAG TPA: HAMP domain-containing sensor histidine kinase, partial [Candidatus Deferrimicrobiaceae bacterium]
MPRFLPSLRDRGLQFKLTLVMLILFVCSLAAVVAPYFWGRESLRLELEKSFLDLSNAIQVSVDQLTAPEDTEQDRLKSYVEGLKRSGIREVSIIDEDMGVIDSTNPKAIGHHAKIKLPKKQLVINATFGDEGPASSEGKIQSKDLVIPVTVGGESLGYIHVRMRIDDFTEPIRKNLYLRTVSTLVIFSLGLAVAVSISSHYVRPVEQLARAAEKVAAGDLSQTLVETGNDEVGRLTRSFNGMIAKLRQNRELEEKVRDAQYLSQLGRLASGVAHEIRNPLNLIGLAVDHLDALTVGVTPEASAEKAQTINRVKEEIQRLNELVTNFIMYGRPPAPSLALVAVPEIIESVMAMAAPRLRVQKIAATVNCEDAPPLRIDPDMIRRAILNVVSNAIDAMPNGGELHISAGPRDEGGYELLIGDTGVGIAEENRDKIFEPYFTTKTSGLGLGLDLTRKIVEAHRGEIVVDSQPGKGTRIHILLPGEPAG